MVDAIILDCGVQKLILIDKLEKPDGSIDEKLKFYCTGLIVLSGKWKHLNSPAFLKLKLH